MLKTNVLTPETKMLTNMDKRSSLQINTIHSHSKRGLISQTSFTSVEESYRNVLHELVNKKDMEDIATEYKNMYEEIQKAKQTQEELTKKNNELQLEMATKVKELETAQMNSKAEKEMIQQLKEEAKRDYKALYSEVCEEQGLKELMDRLWPQMLKMNRDLEEMARFDANKTERMSSYNEMKKKLMEERNQLLQILGALKTKLNAAKDKTSALHTKSSKTELKARKLMAELETENQTIASLQREQQILEDKKIAALQEAQMIELEYNALNDKIKEACLKIQQLEDCTKDMEVTNEKTRNDMDNLRQILSTYHGEYRTLIDHLKTLGKVFISNSAAHGDISSTF